LERKRKGKKAYSGKEEERRREVEEDEKFTRSEEPSDSITAEASREYLRNELGF